MTSRQAGDRTASRLAPDGVSSLERAAEVRAALGAVIRRIEAAGGDPSRVTVVGVTKGHPAPAVSAALAAGLTDLGENYAAELVAKAGEAAGVPPAAAVRWHFLGAIQRNKVGALAPWVSVWQTVDRPEEAQSVARAHAAAGRPERASVMVQVRLAGGENRGGCAPQALEELVGRCRPLVDVVGLMAVGPDGPPEHARAGFRWLAERSAALGLTQVSMGMSADLEVAVEEGSTMVRVGTALFGPRPKGPDLGR